MTALRRHTLLLAFAMLFGLVGAAFTPTVHALVDETQVRVIGEKLQCPVCEGTSVADSPSPVAQGMKETIRQMLAGNRTQKEILDFFVDRYGPGVLREPPKTGFYSAVWWVPFAAIFVVAGAALFVIRRQRISDAARPAPGHAPASTQDAAAYRDRMRKEIDEGNQ